MEVARGADGPRRRRRRREDRHTISVLYGQLHARVPENPTEESLGAEFSDKELRVLMRENGLMINTFSPIDCRYVEKTKHEKISMLLRIITRLTHPETVLARAMLTKSRDVPLGGAACMAGGQIPDPRNGSWSAPGQKGMVHRDPASMGGGGAVNPYPGFNYAAPGAAGEMGAMGAMAASQMTTIRPMPLQAAAAAMTQSADAWSRSPQYDSMNSAARSFQAGDLISRGAGQSLSSDFNMRALKRLRLDAFSKDAGLQLNTELGMQQQLLEMKQQQQQQQLQLQHQQQQQQLQLQRQQLQLQQQHQRSRQPAVKHDAQNTTNKFEAITKTESGAGRSGISLAAARGILLLSDDSAQHTAQSQPPLADYTKTVFTDSVGSGGVGGWKAGGGRVGGAVKQEGLSPAELAANNLYPGRMNLSNLM